MSKKTLVQFIVAGIGAALIIYFGGVWLFLGIFLFMWSNNIMMSEHTKKEIREAFDRMNPRY